MKNWIRVGVVIGMVLVSLIATGTGGEKKPEAVKSYSVAFVGSKKCMPCHIAIYKSWEATNMAKAYESLKPGVKAEAKQKAGLDPQKDYTTDAVCLGCHTTGYGKPGGFVSLEKTPTLAGVGCEACHGAGTDYLKEGLMTMKTQAHSLDSVRKAGLIYPPSLKDCATCHNEKSPFNEKLDKKYQLKFDKETLTQSTHTHSKLKYDHGKIEGSFFQVEEKKAG